MTTISSDWLERARRGDRRAIESIVREVYPLVHNVCRRVLGGDADDATQNALINIVRHLERFDGRSSFTTWVYRVATNAALDEARRRQRHRSRNISVVPDVIDDANSTLNDRVLDAEYVQPLLAQLPEEFRVAVVLRDVMDLDYDEIADILDIPGGTVRSRIARGRAKLADLAREINQAGNQPVADERHNQGREP